MSIYHYISSIYIYFTKNCKIFLSHIAEQFSLEFDKELHIISGHAIFVKKKQKIRAFFYKTMAINY